MPNLHDSSRLLSGFLSLSITSSQCECALLCEIMPGPKCDCDEAEVGILGLVVEGRDAPPVLGFVEQALDRVTPFVFPSV